MGYDVDAFAFDGRSVTSDPILSAAFAEAAEAARRLGHGVDGFLHIGSLDCGDCIAYLEEALGRRCGTGTDGLSAEELRVLSEAARWPEPASIPADLLWAYWSARKFLEVCKEQGLGIWSP